MDDLDLSIFASSKHWLEEDSPSGPRHTHIGRFAERKFLLTDIFLRDVRKRRAGLCQAGAGNIWQPAFASPPCAACGCTYERDETAADDADRVEGRLVGNEVVDSEEEDEGMEGM